MLLDVEIRGCLSYYCVVTKQNREKAANQALSELLKQSNQEADVSRSAVRE